jgi:hypothetical protein
MIIFDEKKYNPESAEFDANHANQRKAWKAKVQVHAINENRIVNMFGNAFKDGGEEEQNLLTAANQFAGLATNDGKPALDFWRSTDRTIREVMDNDQGRDLVGDLMGISTALDIGVTSNAYGVETDLSKEVIRSMDFQTRVGKDHNEIGYDSDPIPTFTAGYGVSFRKARGGLRVGIDLAASSLRLKSKWMISNIADYFLTGDTTIKVDGAVGQGIKNHRNTKKINLGASGFNIDLSASATTNDNIFQFWTRDFIKQLDDNYCQKVDVLWVSPDIMRRLNLAYSASGAFKEGTLKDYVMNFTNGRIGDIRQTFKLTGNEFLCYVRSKEYITPLVGAPMSTVPVPRVMPYDNFNFALYAAVGLQIKADVNGRGGVFYAGNLG